MVHNIFSYRRPSFVERLASSNASQCESEYALQRLQSRNGSSRNIAGVPDELSFDRIIDGGTCPPMTCRDFLHYLIYVEHCAENLQFYLWYKDYLQRFEKLPNNEKELSPEYKMKLGLEGLDEPSPVHSNAKVPKEVQRFVNNVFATHGSRDGGLTEPRPAWTTGGGTGDTNPFPAPPSPGSTENSHYSSMISPFAFSGTVSVKSVDHKNVAAEAFEGVDVKWQPFSIQPFRDEISRVIAIYLAEGAPRELNLSSRDRTAVIKALANTTHPSAMKRVKDHIEDLLRFQSHPNFVRWSICNGNKPRTTFALWLGSSCIAIGLLASLLCTLSSARRGWRLFGAIGYLLGTATLFAASKGMCVVLHGRHRRHVRPWELWNNDSECELKGSKASFETSGTSNSYEDEPWVEQYSKRNILAKIFDKEIWIEEPALREVQDTIAIQSILYAALFTGVLTGVFMAVPGGNFF